MMLLSLLLVAVMNLEVALSFTSPFSGINVALNRHTKPTPAAIQGNASSRAVDGILQACFSTTTNTRGVARLWVNLGKNYIINGITIRNWKGREAKLNNFKVIGNTNQVVLHDDETAKPKLYLRSTIHVKINSTLLFSAITIEVPVQNGESTVNLCELEIYSGYNIARGKRTTHEPGTLGNYVSSRAVDGNMDGSQYSQSCSSTSPAKNARAVWSVDLGGEYVIRVIRIYNWSGRIYKLKNFKVFGHPNNVDLRSIDAAPQQHGFDITFNNARLFSNISIVVPVHQGPPDNGTSYVNFCEVNIISVPNKCSVKYIFENITWAVDGGYLNTANGEVPAGTLIKFGCKKGFGLAGISKVFCRSNGSLSGDIPQCNVVPEVQSSIAAAVGGGVAGVVVLVIFAGVVFYIFRKRRKTLKQRDVPGQLQDVSLRFSNIKHNVKEIDTTKKDRIAVNDDKGKKRMAIFQTTILVEDLADVVLNEVSAKTRFSEEFKIFQAGMTKPHERASQNKTKNRYRNMHAYDDTSVVLDKWDPVTDTDYINASYINGFQDLNAYIATQGPMTDTINDFWRMIWQTGCGKIAMLTNLIENGKAKCIQYWPTTVSQVYGHIKVTLKYTDSFSTFVIRTLIVEKDGESPRQVQHFHFTAWPDKDVPSFCSSLVHFRNKVKSAKPSCSGPLVVHCSAGVGRTGTFIAIDYLADQAQAEGKVDVVRCVETLRQQRVDMVQKENQYVFVHKALVEILLMGTSVVPTSTFAGSYENLVDVSYGKRKIDIEYQLLAKLSPKCDRPHSENSDDIYKEKSRYQYIRPAEEYMPSLSQPGLHLYDEFISAAFLPMYRDNNAMIITQTPLESTKEDFWKMVYHQDVHTIVMMDHPKEVYWPGENKSIPYGDITIANKSTEQSNTHTLIELKVSRAAKELDVQLIQFGKWVAGDLVPDNPQHVLSALELVETNQRQSGNRPVAVHCMDGFERSGLFCVIAALLDRTKIEQDVAISQVIQEMRNRRPNIIPNENQFQFCHEVVLLFLQQYQSYSNFTFTK